MKHKYPETGHATFSPCRAYRYTLWRRWGDGPFCMFIGLNPSTADENQNDPTVRRCIRFAMDWGYDALLMTNMFAYRSTDPMGMIAQDDPVGPENNQTLFDNARAAGIVIAAWGNHGTLNARDHELRRLMPVQMHCLGHNKGGQPKHPLYVAADTKPVLL